MLAGPTFAGAFGYADDVALIALKKMISVCESYAERHHIIFNPTKSKLLCYNVDPSSLGPIYMYLNNQSISIISHDKHLGNYITTDIHDRNIIAIVVIFISAVTVLLVSFMHVIVKH